jgi:hypothetical protein
MTLARYLGGSIETNCVDTLLFNRWCDHWRTCENCNCAFTETDLCLVGLLHLERLKEIYLERKEKYGSESSSIT